MITGQRFESINDDFPIARANCIYQDDYGFLWFGTRDGLVKYDGISPIYYRKSLDDPYSLPGPEVLSIVQVSDSILFVGLSALGLVKFNRNTGKSYPFSPTDSLNNQNIYSLIKDSRDNIWIGTNQGLYRYSHGEIIHFKNKHNHGYGLITNEIRKVFEDANGNIWIASTEGIHRYTYKKNKIENPKTNPNFPHQRILDINMDKEESIWISVKSNEYQLYKWEEEHKRFSPDVRFKNEGRYRFIFDQSNTLWISSDREGVIKYDDTSFVLFSPEKYQEHGLRSVFTQTIFIDKYQNIWLHGDDIYKISGNNKNFKRIDTDGFQVSGLFVDEDFIWYCSKEPMRQSKKNGISQPLLLEETSTEADKSNVIRMYHFEELGDSLIFTSINDIYIWDRKQDSATKFRTNLEGAFRDFIVIKDKNILVADNAENVMIFNPKSKSLKTYVPLRIIKYPNSVASSKDGTQWWGTSENGLYMYNPNLEEIKHYIPDQNNAKNSLSSFNINDVFCHSDGTVWIATKLGLDKINPISGEVTQVQLDSNPQQTFISSILEDKNGNLWLGSQNGLIFLNPELNEVKKYTKDDGLLNTIYTPRASSIDEKGYLYFGGKEGIDYFQPDEINENRIPPDLYIRSLKVNGQIYSHEIAGENLKEIFLSHKDKYLEIELLGLHMTSANGNVFSYKLEPQINEWIDIGKNRIITLGKLPAGEYQLIAKSANIDGKWSEPKILLIIHIKSPFWKTAWFIATMILVFFGIFYLINRQRIQRFKQKEKNITIINKQIAEMEMKALRAQMNPHFLFNCLNSIKLLIDNNENRKAKEYISKFSGLIRQVLDNSRKKMVRLDEEIKTIEFYLQLEQLRFKNFSYQINVDKDVPADFIEIPPLLIQPYVENAIWHGLMNKESSDRELTIKIVKELENTLIVIEDNGIGRKQAQELKSTRKNKITSIGTQLSFDSIDVFNKIYNKNISIQIVDMTNPTGTKVNITIPE
jgi:ligand-binding sensor domain-containing protein